MPQILQARLHQYMNCELPDVQAGFRKGRGIGDQMANIHWIFKKAREFQKNLFLLHCTEVFDYVDHNKLWKILRNGNTQPPFLPSEKLIYGSRSNS